MTVTESRIHVSSPEHTDHNRTIRRDVVTIIPVELRTHGGGPEERSIVVIFCLAGLPLNSGREKSCY